MVKIVLFLFLTTLVNIDSFTLEDQFFYEGDIVTKIEIIERVEVCTENICFIFSQWICEIWILRQKYRTT